VKQNNIFLVSNLSIICFIAKEYITSLLLILLVELITRTIRSTYLLLKEDADWIHFLVDISGSPIPGESNTTNLSDSCLVTYLVIDLALDPDRNACLPNIVLATVDLPAPIIPNINTIFLGWFCFSILYVSINIYLGILCNL